MMPPRSRSVSPWSERAREVLWVALAFALRRIGFNLVAGRNGSLTNLTIAEGIIDETDLLSADGKVPALS